VAQVPDPSFWQWLAEHLWMPLVGLLTVWWSMLQNRIRAVEITAKDAVTGEEFVTHVARADKQFDELRSDIRNIFDVFRAHEQEDRRSHDELVATMHRNHSEILDYLLKRNGR
jgi:hypothetical protein